MLARWSPSRQCCLRACSTCHASCCTAWRRAPRGASPRRILHCSCLESDILSIMLVAVPICLSVNPSRHIIRMLVAVPIYLSINPSRHIIHMLVVSVNPSRHIIHNYVSCCSHLPVRQSIQTHYPYVSCCSHLPVHQSVQTHYPYVSCCSHLPVHQSIHQCPCWILPAPVLSRQGLSPLLLCLFSVKSWGLFREVTLSEKKRKAKRWVG